jgi:hypothetical protein
MKPRLEGRKLICAAVLLFATLAHAKVTSFSITPSATDPAIKTFDSPHYVYVDRNIVVEKKGHDRHELLLFLTGTGGKGAGAKAFCTLAAELGYHVVNLMYPDDIPATICGRDSDPKAYEEFRMAIIQGGISQHITITRSDSIENRLVKALNLLKQKRPREGWAQFLEADGRTIKWETIAVAGQSQGGGHAALIGIKHRVARVIATGAPKDYSVKLDAPAAWLGEESATPAACFFTFNHQQDIKGATYKQLLKNMAALKIDALGAPADAATEPYPYHHTRILTTSYPSVVVTGVNSDGAKAAHTSVIADINAARWKQVWTYMLTEKTR